LLAEYEGEPCLYYKKMQQQTMNGTEWN
jgi:hypothetical protein